MLETYEPAKKINPSADLLPNINPVSVDTLAVSDHVLHSESKGLMSVFRSADILDDQGKIPEDEAYEKANTLVNLSNNLRKYASLAFLFFLWVNFYRSANSFFHAKNKKWNHYLDFTVNSVATLGLTALYIFSIASLGTACAYVAPYLLTAVLGVKVITSVYNCAKNLYYLYKTGDMAFLTEAAKQLLSIVTYAFGLILTLLLGPQLNQLTQDVQGEADLVRNGGEPDALYDSLGSMKNLFATYQPLITGLVITSVIATTVDLLISTYHLNRETLQDLKNPMQTLQNAWAEARNGKWPTLGAIHFFLKGIAKAISLLLLPIHGIFGLAYKINASLLDDLKGLKNFTATAKQTLNHLVQTPLKTLGMSLVKVIFLPFIALYPFITGIINKKNQPNIAAVVPPNNKNLVNPNKQSLPAVFLQDIEENRKGPTASIGNTNQRNTVYGKSPRRISLFSLSQSTVPCEFEPNRKNRPTI